MTRRQREKYLTMREAATEHVVSLATLKRMLRRGILTRYRQPGVRETLLLRSQLSEVLQPQAS